MGKGGGEGSLRRGGEIAEGREGRAIGEGEEGRGEGEKGREIGEKALTGHDVDGPAVLLQERRQRLPDAPRRGAPVAVAPEGPVEAGPEGPDLPCGRHGRAEVAAGSQREHRLVLEASVQILCRPRRGIGSFGCTSRRQQPPGTCERTQSRGT